MHLPNHGANPHQLADALGIALQKDAIDFSVNTNPFGPPNFVKNMNGNVLLHTITDYPDPHVHALTALIEEQNRVSHGMVLVGNGAAELIFLIATLFRENVVTLVEPCFSEYRDACTAHQCEVRSFILDEPWDLTADAIKKLVDGTDLIFLCSPSNPTGVRFSEEKIRELLHEANDRDVHVIIDEAFYDFCEDGAGLEHLLNEFPQLILLRSLTKMYTIAGVRLGYVMANERIIEQLRALQPPWSVNGLAQIVGFELLRDDSYVKETVAAIHAEKQFVTNELIKLNFDVSRSVVNFYLISEKDKRDLQPLFLFLLERGVVARHTYNFSGLNGRYLRLAVKDRSSNEQLIALLTEWRER